MATTTPFYGWSVPTSTDLVKDGASAIETLGDSIDASMNTALGTKKAGMVLLNTTSFSAVSSVSLAVASFSASYRSYKLIINQTASTSNVELSYRMRVSGADNSTSNYYGSGFQSIFTGSSGVDFTDNATSAGTLGEVSVDGALFEIHLMNPFETQRTQFFTLNNTANGGKTIFAGGFIALTTSFDAISFYPVSGTITGRYQLFGVNE
jgi:hypothetical protein